MKEPRRYNNWLIVKQLKNCWFCPQLTLPPAWGLRPSRARLLVVWRLSKGSGNPMNGWPTREERRTPLNKKYVTRVKPPRDTSISYTKLHCLLPHMRRPGCRSYLKNGSFSKSDPKRPRENILFDYSYSCAEGIRFGSDHRATDPLSSR